MYEYVHFCNEHITIVYQKLAVQVFKRCPGELLAQLGQREPECNGGEKPEQDNRESGIIVCN